LQLHVSFSAVVMLEAYCSSPRRVLGGELGEICGGVGFGAPARRSAVPGAGVAQGGGRRGRRRGRRSSGGGPVLVSAGAGGGPTAVPPGTECSPKEELHAQYAAAAPGRGKGGGTQEHEEFALSPLRTPR